MTDIFIAATFYEDVFIGILLGFLFALVCTVIEEWP